MLKPVRPESLHVTLVFLGHREAAEVEAIADVVRETESEMVLSKLEDPIPMPGRRRASMFALPAPSPATGDLQRDLVARLAEEGLHEPEERDFWPHVTVARVRSEGSRIAPSGGGRKMARGASEVAQRAVLWRPIDALPFCTPAGGLPIRPAGPSRAAQKRAAVR